MLNFTSLEVDIMFGFILLVLGVLLLVSTIISSINDTKRKLKETEIKKNRKVYIYLSIFSSVIIVVGIMMNIIPKYNFRKTIYKVPVSVEVETFGKGSIPRAKAEAVMALFSKDFGNYDNYRLYLFQEWEKLRRDGYRPDTAFETILIKNKQIYNEYYDYVNGYYEDFLETGYLEPFIENYKPGYIANTEYWKTKELRRNLTKQFRVKLDDWDVRNLRGID